MNNQDSLRKQLTDAMAPRLGAPLADSVFKCDLWPVLESAMAAGELLVHRATVPKKPVHEAITFWLTQRIAVFDLMLAERNTISKARLLKTIEQFIENGNNALREAESVKAPSFSLKG